VKLETLGIAGLGLYLLALVAVAVVARRARRDSTPADHFLAGRELGMFVLFLTLYATAYSGNSLLGYPGEAYRRGFSWVMATGFMLSVIVAFHIMVPRLRPAAVRGNFVTPGDWVRARFGDAGGGLALQRGVAVLMTIALANFLFAQLKAMGVMAEQVTGGFVSFEAGVVVLAAMILMYETLGGMRAVAWTDTAQGILMLLGLGALLMWLLGEAGGLSVLTTEVARMRPSAVWVPETVERTNWASTILLMALASVVYPQAIQRVYAAKSGVALRRALALMSFMPLTTTWVVTLIGLAAIPRFESLGDVAADRVMPLLLGSWAEAGLASALGATLVFLGALAAIMSTADSVLLSLGSLAAKDLVRASDDPAATTRLGKRIATVVMVAMAGLVLWARGVTLWGLIELKMELLIQCVPAFLIALHWKRLRADAAFAGLVVGTAIAIAGVGFGLKRIEGVHIGILGLAVNVAISVVGSLGRESVGRER
jgi:Na+/proline symporter